MADQQQHGVIVELDRMAAEFNSICRAYKGYLPGIETPDIRTRLMHIGDATKTFDNAYDAIRRHSERPGMEGK